MMDAHPGCPALEKIFHKAAIIKMVNASQQIQKTGPGACPCEEDEYEYSICAMNEVVFATTFWMNGASDIIGGKSLRLEV